MENDWGILTISEDLMQATISKKKLDINHTTEITEKMVTDMLKFEGIKAVPNEEAIKFLINEAAFGQPVVVAEGKEVKNGTDGYVHYYIPVQDAKTKPIINEDGSADYKNSLKLAIVEEGQLIGKHMDPTPGEFGYNVYFQMISPKPGKTLPQFRGRGIVYNPETKEYVAEYSGHIVENGRFYKIEKLYRVNGDLDIETGNIDFNGDVEVTGDMRSGYTIRADGDVFIGGHVGACNIISKKNVTISKGIQGRDKCVIIAEGDVACKFVERARIMAEGNIYADSVLLSTLESKREVFITGNSSQVISSNVCGIVGVTVKDAGNQKEIPTVLQTGVTVEMARKARELTQQIKELDSKMDALEQHRKVIAQVPEPSEEMKDVLTKILRSKVLVSSEKNKLCEELAPINKIMELAKSNSKVTVLGVANAGLTVHINGNRLNVSEAIKDVHFKMQDNKVVMFANYDEE